MSLNFLKRSIQLFIFSLFLFHATLSFAISPNDISDSPYQENILAAIEADLFEPTDLFYPENYFRLEDEVMLLLKITHQYENALNFEGGPCPETPLYSYATTLGIYSSNSCPSMRAKRRILHLNKFFQLAILSQGTQEMKTTMNELSSIYNGPSLKGVKKPYGLVKKYFKYSFMSHALVGLDPNNTEITDVTYGRTFLTRGHAAAIIMKLLEGIQSSSNDNEEDTYWQPQAGLSWQLQLQGEINTTYPVAAYDIDLFDTPQNIIDTLHQQGKKVICYFSAGSFENWREDANLFPASVKGNSNGWPGEKWLDIRQLDILQPIMAARMDLAIEKSCDAVDPDNVDGYTNKTGLPLTYADQLNYNMILAQMAHERGLAIGLKNDLNQIEDLVSTYDFAINEECFSYNECDLLLPFIEENKPVLGVQYESQPEEICPESLEMGMSFILKDYDLFDESYFCGS